MGGSVEVPAPAGGRFFLNVIAKYRVVETKFHVACEGDGSGGLNFIRNDSFKF
jgi:hypothetical protein